ncbi:flagellar hook-associated protein FlgL [Hylemonella gracilis]|uniref:Flagellar hook-associated protein 3 n=1 Tax=Hylemonella gracilis ATCC 19624 TaxID=887062 RepID=F3KXZ2_9BURK|nr:flagellar hook-associated protein FlgL [Hylemonella gracilis]EGI75417.1 flagellar hook-associated protein 3 [Hylemonella gracilis ATCC 19624]
MAMRLGTANSYDRTLSILTQRQVELSQQQEKLAAGKKVLRGSDDPTGAAQAERAMTRSTRVDVEVRALNLQRNTVALTEGTLGNSMDLLQKIREKLVYAGDGALTPDDRAALALEIKGMRDQLFGYAIKQDSNGIPLFGGLGSAPQAFTDEVTGVTFNGTTGNRASTLVSVPGTMDGQAVWMNVPTGNGIFTTDLGMGTIPTSPTALIGNFTTGVPASPTDPDWTYDKTMNTVNKGEVWAGVGQVVDPAALTGNNYIVRFNVTPQLAEPAPVSTNPDNWTLPAVVTYDVYRYDPIADPTGAAAVAVASDQPYTEGQDIIFDGVSITPNGKPADGDTLSIQASKRTDLFAVLDDAIAAIDGAANGYQLSQDLAVALTQLDSGKERLSSARSEAGVLLNRTDIIETTQGDKTLQLAADRSRAEDMDMIKGISDMQNMQVGYQAALQTYAQVQRLSLFNFIS